MLPPEFLHPVIRSLYILYSEKLNKCYIGACIDMQRRLYEHNIGHSKFTSLGIPGSRNRVSLPRVRKVYIGVSCSSVPRCDFVLLYKFRTSSIELSDLAEVTVLDSKEATKALTQVGTALN